MPDSTPYVTPPAELKFTHLPEFVRFIASQKLEEYARTSLRISRELNIPILQFFAGIPDEELIKTGLERNKQWLQRLSDNQGPFLIEEATRNWVANRLPGIQREQIVADDILLVSLMRKKVFQELLPSYTTDLKTFSAILAEVDSFIIAHDSSLFKTFHFIQQEKINAINQDLVKREEELLEAQEIGQMGSFEWSLSGQKSIYTPHLLKIFELEAAETLASFMDHVHAEDRERLTHALENAMKTGNFDCEYRYQRNQHEKTLWSRGRVFFEGPKPQKLVGTVMDVTERSKIVERLAALNATLEHKNQELIRSNKELESFNFIASHDLQEPLRKIRMYSSRILESEPSLPEPASGYAYRMNQAASRMQTLIDDFLVFSKTVAAPQPASDLDLNHLLEEVKTTLASAIAEKSAVIQSHDLPVICAIPFQMHQLLTNLISNAIKYSREGVAPVIDIQARKTTAPNDVDGLTPGKKYVELTVADNGIGFEQKYEHKIFELFQRLHTKEKYSGTGIGLAICKRIAENHHGVIKVKSEPGKGTAFTVWLEG